MCNLVSIVNAYLTIEHFLPTRTFFIPRTNTPDIGQTNCKFDTARKSNFCLDRQIYKVLPQGVAKGQWIDLSHDTQ